MVGDHMGILGAVVLPFPPPSLFALPSPPPPPPSVDTAQRLRALGRGTSLGVRAAARRELSSFFSPSSLDGRGPGDPQRAVGGPDSKRPLGIGKTDRGALTIWTVGAPGSGGRKHDTTLLPSLQRLSGCRKASPHRLVKSRPPTGPDW